MKRLILVGGPMGVGKTAVCRELQRILPNNVFLDGDWCWDMRPFVVTDETRTMVLENICSVLNRFLACSAYENIIFCWVMNRRQIAEDILVRLNLDGVQVRHFSLVADAASLEARIRGDIGRGLRSVDVLERSLSYLEDYRKLDTEKIDTSAMDAAETARQLALRIRK